MSLGLSATGNLVKVRRMDRLFVLVFSWNLLTIGNSNAINSSLFQLTTLMQETSTEAFSR